MPLSGHSDERMPYAGQEALALPRPLSMLSRQRAAVLAVDVVLTLSALDILTGCVTEPP